MKHEHLLQEMVARLRHALGPELESVVLYGPLARGDEPRAAGHLHLMIVLADLEPPTLARLVGPTDWWLGRDQPWPRLFSQQLIEDSRDVFPIEFLDIARHHRVLHGHDVLVQLRVERRHLRVQCERELREKLMRLREGYIECAGRRRALRRLMAESHASFVPVWRACLHLLGAAIPVDDPTVTELLCQRLDLDHAPLVGVAAIAAGDRPADPEELFTRYYRVVSAVTARIDRMVEPANGEVT